MELKQQILKKSQKFKNETADILSRLVRQPSLSCQEKNVAYLLAEMMRSNGFDEVRLDGLGNVIGRIGSGKRVIALDGHIDVVDVGERSNWSFDPYCGEVKDGYVHGRGSVDQKGGVASFVTAGKILKEIGLDKDLTIYFTGTVMEEDCDGLCWKYLIEEENIRPEAVIVTEPTNLRLHRGQRGRMEIGVTFKGVSSHGSAPERGDNALYQAARCALEVEKLNERLYTDPFLGKGTVTVTDFQSRGPSLCAVPDHAALHLDRRLTWTEDRDLALNQVRRLIPESRAEVRLLEYQETAYTGLVYGMEKYYPTWKLEENHPLIRRGAGAFKELFDKEPEIDKWTFSTNGVVINGLHGIPVLGFGPGNEVLAHAPDEKTPVDQLVAAAAFYAYFCATY